MGEEVFNIWEVRTVSHCQHPLRRHLFHNFSCYCMIIIRNVIVSLIVMIIVINHVRTAGHREHPLRGDLLFHLIKAIDNINIMISVDDN